MRKEIKMPDTLSRVTIPMSGLILRRPDAKYLKKWGFRFHKSWQRNDTVREVTIPSGWSFLPHSRNGLQAVILDDQGRERIKLFYNLRGKFWTAYPIPRFGLREIAQQDGRVDFQVLDTGKVIFTTEPLFDLGDSTWNIALRWLINERRDWDGMSSWD